MGPDEPLTRDELEGLRKATLAGDSIVPVPQAVLRTLLAGYHAPGRVELLDMADERISTLLQLLEDEREAVTETRCDYRSFHVSIADFRHDGSCSDCNEGSKHANHRLVAICKEGNPEFFAEWEKKIQARRDELAADARIEAENRTRGYEPTGDR